MSIVRVFILTLPLGQNYGGVLQAYALQMFLKQIGCDVETLNRCAQTSWVATLRIQLKNLAKLVLGRIEHLPTGNKQAVIFQHLTQFRDCHINLSKRIVTKKQLSQYCRENHFDVVLVGSDQIWRPRYSPSLFNYYLDFLSDVDAVVTRLSYAASFGVDEWEYTQEETRICKSLIRKFDAISVREASGVKLCKEYFDADAACMVDPTFLLDADEYRKLFRKPDVMATAGKLVVYFLDASPEKERMADKISQWLGIQPYSILPKKKMTDVTFSESVLAQYLPVEQWLAEFGNAEFVVTDSFHGCVFSIIFNKPFIAVGNAKRGLSRFQSLLGDFGLTRRLIFSTEDINRELVISSVDWDAVNRIREEKAESAKRFLRVNIMGDLS